MKKILFLSIATIGILNMVIAQVPCDRIVAISSDITANRTLYRDTIYRISGCVAVTSGNTVTMQSDVHIEFQNNSRFIFLSGASINAVGTATAPIVLTSAVGSPGNRTQVTNAGLIIAGDAPINGGSTLDMPCSRTLTVGSNPTDNSGTIKYMQIHYLSGTSTVNFENALTLAGVGSGTVLQNIEITNSGQNGLGIIGGLPTLKEIVTQDNYENGVFATRGAQVQLQGYLENRKNPNAHSTSGSYGIMIQNNLLNSSATPVTNFNATNITILGPAYCNPEPLSNDFKGGIYIGNNANAEIYNTVIAGCHGNGLYLDGAACIGKTGTNQIQFSYNSFYMNQTDFDASANWISNSGCNTSMLNWLTGGGFGCEESGNQITAFTLGYNGTLCDDYCSTSFMPDFALTSASELDAPNGISVYDDRGALQSNNLYDWITVCPQDKVYCTAQLTPEGMHRLNFIPNPSNGHTLAEFVSDVTGTATISIMDKVTGSVLRSINAEVREAGKQKLSFSVQGLQEGIYPVRIEIKGMALSGLIVVR